MYGALDDADWEENDEEIEEDEPEFETRYKTVKKDGKKIKLEQTEEDGKWKRVR